MPPLVGVAVNVTLLPEHVGLDPDVIAMLTDGVSLAVTANAMPVDEAVPVVTHVRLVVISTVIVPPVVPASVYVALLVPTGLPSFLHWYVGVPPLVGVAVKVTLLPEQVGFVPDVIAILTDGVTLAVTLNAIALLVAVVDVTHDKLLVITTVILPDEVPGSVYVGLCVPTSTPPFFHW